MKRTAEQIAFYKTRAWKRCREEYARSVGYLCERCLKSGIVTAGEIVHHKVHLNPDNFKDPSIALSFDNLELLCRKCHAEEHDEIYGHDKRRYRVENGKLIIKN